MSFLLAFAVCFAGVAGLFYLDRDKSVRTSKALWLPVIWLSIIGSRPVTAWLGIWFGIGLGPTAGGLDAQLEGNFVDMLVFMALLAGGIVVLYRRKNRTRAFLRASVPLLIYFTYCLVSVLWSPFTDVAFKRWVKGVGDLVMVLIVVTDGKPIAALQRLFSRVGFILLPASVLLIRYSYLGRGFDPWGNPSNVGVSTNKNSLGLITFVLCLGVLWNVRSLLRAQRQPARNRRLLAQCALLAFGIAVLEMAQSATSISCFILGGGLMLVTGLSWVRRHPSRMDKVVLVTALIAAIAMVSGADETAVHALGRKTDLTGRTQIWKTVIPLAQNPIIGAGFESFWNASSARLAEFTGDEGRMFRNLNSAHNGYIDVYLNLGWIGLCLLVAILISGYRRAGAAFRRDPQTGGLILAFIVTAAIYSITEAGFRLLTPSWMVLLLAIVTASGVSSGCLRTQPAVPSRRRKSRDNSSTPGRNDPPASGRADADEAPDWTTVESNLRLVPSRPTL
jgi:exopolysaccharide production protein ExoQ